MLRDALNSHTSRIMTAHIGCTQQQRKLQVPCSRFCLVQISWEKKTPSSEFLVRNSHNPRRAFRKFSRGYSKHSRAQRSAVHVVSGFKALVAVLNETLTDTQTHTILLGMMAGTWRRSEIKLPLTDGCTQSVSVQPRHTNMYVQTNHYPLLFCSLPLGTCLLAL